MKLYPETKTYSHASRVTTENGVVYLAGSVENMRRLVDDLVTYAGYDLKADEARSELGCWCEPRGCPCRARA